LEYFVRVTDARNESKWRGSAPLVRQLYPEQAYPALDQAIDQAKRTIMKSERNLMLQADACFRNKSQVTTKYRCWIDARGEFNEITLR